MKLELLLVLALPYTILVYSTHLLSVSQVPSTPIQTSGHRWQSRSWQLRKELPLEASSTSASPPIATHTMAKSVLMRRFISPLQQVTYSRGSLITAIAGGRNLPQQPGLPCSCDFKEHKLISRIPSL